MKIMGGLPIVLSTALGTVVAWIAVTCLFVLTCTPGWNDPHPIVPEPGLPCGRIYHTCPQTGGCCMEDEACGVEGHACGLHDCCFVGERFGARRKHRQWLPSEIPPDPPWEGGRP